MAELKNKRTVERTNIPENFGPVEMKVQAMDCSHANLDESNKDASLLEECATESKTVTTQSVLKLQVSVNKLRVVMTVVTKMIFPAVVKVYYAIVRNQKIIVEGMRLDLIPIVIAYVMNSLSHSLSSVQDVVFRPSRKELPQFKPKLENQQHPTSSFLKINQVDEKPEKSVTCEILASPPVGTRLRADVVFVHGLHGSLIKTWRKGNWNDSKRQVELIRYRACKFKRSHSTPCCSTSVSVHTRNDNYSFISCDVNDDVTQIQELRKIGPIENSQINETDRTRAPSNCWPRDWLPLDCPDVRVIAVNYTTDPYLWRPVWVKERRRSSMRERAREMMENLLKLNVGRNPIIWVAHSKGGLFVKQMIVDAWESTHELNSASLRSLCTQTRGIMFYSVPHRGSSLADVTLPLLRKSVELMEIRRDCPGVLELHKRFVQICQSGMFDAEVFSFIETSLTSMSILYLRIVDLESADPGLGETYGVQLDHRDICKPSSRDCFLYQKLTELINKVD